MNTAHIRTPLSRFVMILSVVAALFMIPIAFMISLLLPLQTWMSFALILLPSVVLAACLIKIALAGQLSRATSPVSFYAAIATNALFLCIAVAALWYVTARGLSPTIEVLRSVKYIQYGKPFGLLADKTSKHELLKDCLRMEILCFLFQSREEPNVAILNYNVRSYNLQSITSLFAEIFIHQQYYFVTDSKRPFVVDCGSHIGMSVLYIKKLYPDAQVVAFEPAPDNFRLLNENVKRNALKDVILVNKAVAKKEGKMKFYGDDSQVASLFESRTPGQGATDVEVVKLSTYINQPVDFLKMDIEGAESEVLNELAAAGKLHMIKQMIIEYHHHFEKEVDSFSKFLKTLEDHGFGYQITCTSPLPTVKKEFQDIMVYAYRKI